MLCIVKKTAIHLKQLPKICNFKLYARRVLIFIFRKTADEQIWPEVDTTHIALLYHILWSLDGQGYQEYIKIQKEKYSDDILISWHFPEL